MARGDILVVAKFFSSCTEATAAPVFAVFSSSIRFPTNEQAATSSDKQQEDNVGGVRASVDMLHTKRRSDRRLVLRLC